MEKNNNILEKTGNRKHFSVPENYFENFAAVINKKISEKETPTISLFSKMKPYIYGAAMFALIFTAGHFVTKNSENKNAIAYIEETQTFDQSDLLLAYVDESTLTDFIIENDYYNDYE